ncbi:MAG: energy-coupling factor transporter transmembrane component T [Candidatus Nanopelagicaceae bacterium]|nr:energy-coupling factor transporter transmembrane component T [Candidatus Nanopelagicaceae bacterium]
MDRSLHPLTWWIWAGALAISAARQSSVLMSIAMVGVVAIVVIFKSEDAPWAQSFKFALKLGFWIFSIRTLTGILIGVPIPGRTLFSIPILPLPSWMAGIRLGGNVTLERLSLTAHEGVMLATIVALLGAAASLSSPHRLLRSLPITIYEFGVAVVIATSLIPQLVTSVTRIREAQRLRGQDVRGLKSWRRVALPLLEDSLSRSLDLAAAMDARGYGFSRKRSRYRPNSWHLREVLICLSAIAAIAWPSFALMAAITAFVLAPNLKIYPKVSVQT